MLADAYFATPEIEAVLAPLMGHAPGFPLKVNPIDGFVADQIREGAIILGMAPAITAPKPSSKAPTSNTSEG